MADCFVDPAVIIRTEVICEAVGRWCVNAGVMPTTVIVKRAIRLYNSGNHTASKLLAALRTELLN